MSIKIKIEETIGLIVDYQEKILPAINEKEWILNNAEKLITGMKLLEVPVILSQQYSKGLGNTVQEITDAAHTKEYFDKTTFSCYSNQEIKQWINNQKQCKNVIICGIESHICVLLSALELKEAGYRPILVTDCMSSRRTYDHEVAIQRATQNGIEVTTYESILFELLGDAKHPKFKEISAIIK